MGNSLNLKIGDTVRVKRATHDGNIWLDGKVVFVGQATFKAEISGSIVLQLEYANVAVDWRLPRD